MTMTTTESENRAMPDKPVIDDKTLDTLMNQIETEGLELLGPDGVLTELTSRIMNRALEAEMTHHLGYEKGDQAGWGSGNNRNGHSAKNVKTDAGNIPVTVPRDRQGTFDPVVVPKHSRRLEGFNNLVCGLLSRGVTTRDICSQLRDTYGVEISAGQVSVISDAILPELQEWRTRALDPIYPILYLDAIIVKIRTDGKVINRPCYLGLGINLEGEKHVLGMWLGDGGEGSKFWLGVCAELANRGVKDVLIVEQPAGLPVTGLTGFPEAIEATWPEATVQTSLVHYGHIREHLGCHRQKPKRTSANRTSSSRCRPVPSVSDGPQIACRSRAQSAVTSSDHSPSTWMTKTTRRTSLSCQPTPESTGAEHTTKPQSSMTKDKN